MAVDNQHFCLRWNNHQSTLISVFDTLLESGTLVDCTLAAEGQYLKAHKVVLSACSPYLELLLSQHYEKHPIVILKDVKFQELKSMMDYMYRGEVNISQDQLSTFLKAAESLQIKGLTDGGGNEDGTTSSAPVKAPIATPVRKPVQQSVTRGPSAAAVQGLTIERRAESPHIRSRDDSASPTPRKRRRNQRRPSTSDDPDSHIDTSNSCDVPPHQSGALSGVGVPNIPATITKGVPLDDGDHETENSRINNHDASADGVAGPKIEPTGELIEPKTEYTEDMNNEDSIEDLTLDDDDDMDNSMDMSRAGPSHDNSNQSFGQWPMSGNQTNDEVFMSAQEAVGSHRDTQELRKLLTAPLVKKKTNPTLPTTANVNISQPLVLKKSNPTLPTTACANDSLPLVLIKPNPTLSTTASANDSLPLVLKKPNPTLPTTASANDSLPLVLKKPNLTLPNIANASVSQPTLQMPMPIPISVTTNGNASQPILFKKLSPTMLATTSASAQQILKNDEKTMRKRSEPETESFYRCKNCNNVILGPNVENLYVEHMKTCLDANTHECSICFKKFAHKRGLNNHLTNIHLVFD